MRLSFVGLTLSSSWGNGHATTYRALLSGLAQLGHEVTFYECDRPWYASHRDLPRPDFAKLVLYNDLAELMSHGSDLAGADAVVVGSYVVDGASLIKRLGELTSSPLLFYDIDTPVTLAALDADACAYLDRSAIARCDAYLSFTGGPTLRRLVASYGAREAHALYCSVDPQQHEPRAGERDIALCYLGTYSPDRQSGLEHLLIEPARMRPDLQFVVAGSQYPKEMAWPANVTHLEHVSPEDHAAFYGCCRFTLNLTRADMRAAGWSPSVRLFEAAATETPIISDSWPGLDEVLEPGREILTVETTSDVLDILDHLDAEARLGISRAARERVLAAHTHLHRARELETILEALRATSGSGKQYQMTP